MLKYAVLLYRFKQFESDSGVSPDERTRFAGKWRIKEKRSMDGGFTDKKAPDDALTHGLTPSGLRTSREACMSAIRLLNETLGVSMGKSPERGGFEISKVGWEESKAGAYAVWMKGICGVTAKISYR